MNIELMKVTHHARNLNVIKMSCHLEELTDDIPVVNIEALLLLSSTDGYLPYLATNHSQYKLNAGEIPAESYLKFQLSQC